MRITLRIGSATVIAAVLTLASGVASASAQAVTAPLLTGSVQSPSSGGLAGSLSGIDAVAAVNTSQGWFAFAPAYFNNELTAVDMSNPTSPVITDEAAPPGTELYAADTVNIYGGVAYVVSKNQNPACATYPNMSGCSNDNGNGNALSLFNVTADPSTPQFLGSITDAATPSNNLFGAYGVAAASIGSDNYAVVAAQGCLHGQPCPDNTVGNDLALIGVDTPSSPQYVGSVSNAAAGAAGFTNALDHPTAVAVSGNYAYVTSFYGRAFTVVDISHPASPSVVAEIPNSTDFPAPVDVAVQGNYAYVANQNTNSSGQGTFTIVDISNPASPQVVGTVNATGLSGGYRVRVSGEFAYVASSGVSSITVVDVSDPASPSVLTSLSSKAHLYKTTGLDLMDMNGNEYAIASSPYLATEPASTANPAYPPYPLQTGGGTATGTISAIQLDPVANAPTIAIQSEPSTQGQPYSSSTSANFIFAASDAVSTVACSLDGGPFKRCTSQTTASYSGLALGQHTFTVRATDAAGNSASASYAWTIEAVATNVTPPTITGSIVAGNTLTANLGSWTGSSLTFAYQWQRCDPQGATCTTLHTTTSTYPLGPADVRHTLRVRITAKNDVSSLSVTSAPTAAIKVCPSSGSAPVYCAIPKLVTRPSITGTTEVGQRLIASAGAWSKLPASQYGPAQGATYAFLWLRCNRHGSQCAAISGATHKTYKTTAKDLGRRLKLQTTASNRNGDAMSYSAPSPLVVKARTKVKLVLTAPAKQRSVRQGFVLAYVRSNVGALVDVSVAVQVHHGAISWTSGTAAEVGPGLRLRFKVLLKQSVLKELQAALAAHRGVRALVTVSSPGHPGIRHPKSHTVSIIG